MLNRPYVLLSCAISMDGYLDDATGTRLMLSNDADLDRVDAVRAGCDGLLVGAQTIRSDDPRLVLRNRSRMNERVESGKSPTPLKVTITERAKLQPDARFFTVGDTTTLVYCTSDTVDQAHRKLATVTTVVDAGKPATMGRLCEDLYFRGVRRLMVEGGGSVHTQFLAADLADELHVVVAPFFVGDSRAPRFVGDSAFPWTAQRPARLMETRSIGDVVLLRYALSERYSADNDTT